jgi:Uncharacterized conserved protein
VRDIYQVLTAKYGNEYRVLLDAPISELEAFNPQLARLIKDMRSNRLRVEPGYDGVYGKLILGDTSFSPEAD